MKPDAFALGATLYLPATRPDLLKIIRSPQVDLRSAVICLEDSVRPQDTEIALHNLRDLLATLTGNEKPHLFVRPRNALMLATISGLPHLDRLAGFVLPKVTAANLPDYLACAGDRHLLMPTLETREVFDPVQMRRLRRQLTAVQDRILALRIGGNDLLQTIGARRSAVRTAYDGPLGHIVATLVTTFAPHGFALSAPVFEHFGNAALLAEEVARDMEHGLYTKTAIHPSQITAIQSLYAVDAEELAEARAILCDKSSAVFGSRGSMCEPQTHQRWAQAVVRRSEEFGTRPGSAVAITA